jgi:osmotically-inducible protein OsmY
MRTDEEIKRDVEDELRWDPDLDAEDIAVAVKDGVVTLTGFVHSYSDKLQAEEDAKRVSGVVAVANDIEVRLPSADVRTDPEIAREIVAELKMYLPFSYEQIKAIVKNGWVTLEGEAKWNYQRERAESAVRRVKGVVGVSNLIKLKPSIEASDLKRKIEAAFKRNAEIDAKRIQVRTTDGEVILEGTVRSWMERQEAERVAWSAPGVKRVEDRIVISL